MQDSTIALWLELLTWDWKIMISNPGHAARPHGAPHIIS